MSQKNRELVFANHELNILRASLESANTELEMRVEQRTCELKKANEALSASLRDVKNAQHQLMQSEQLAAIGQLAAGVAHQINNPIGFVTSNFNALQTYFGRLLALIEAYAPLEKSLLADSALALGIAKARRDHDYDYIREDIPVLIAESAQGLARVKRIVADLLDFAQANSEVWESVDVNYCLDSSVNVVWSDIKEKALIERDYGELPPLRCHPGSLNRVFVNLLLNAAQAIQGRGVITLRTWLEADGVKIAVTDTGCGISKNLQNRIFEPFFTTKPVGRGTGLGLSVVWGIVRNHFGRIELTRDEGRGATFVVFLPLKAAGNENGGESE